MTQVGMREAVGKEAGVWDAMVHEITEVNSGG